MNTDHNLFYTSYLKNYHRVKANYLLHLLKNNEKFNEQLIEDETGFSFADNSRFIILADLRQNYFHAIETLFELFFAFEPKNDFVPDNRLILKSLVKSEWRKNQKEIIHISKGKKKLDFLYKHYIENNGHNVTVGHYLFYNGTYNKGKFDEEYYSKVEISLKAIAKGLKTIAQDFSNNDEYNAYKHGIRIFPVFENVRVFEAKEMKEVFKFDLSNSMSYYLYDDKNKKVSIKTQVLDYERDFRMTEFCSKLIYNIIKLREVVYDGKRDLKKDEQVGIYLFQDEYIENAIKHNVKVQNLSFTEQEL